MSTNKIKILIADDVEETVNVVRRLLSLEENAFEIVGVASNGEEVIKLIPKLKPDVVLMDINMPILNGLEATERITIEFPQVSVIIMSVQRESEYLKKAMFHGAKEYIIKPFDYETLVETIKVTYHRQKDRNVKLPLADELLREGNIIAYFSSKGGVGKSVIALNSAVGFSKWKKKKTLLMDVDLMFGDISIMVNKYDVKNILDAVDDGQLETYEGLKPYLYQYNGGMDILFAPGKPEAVEFIGKSAVERIIKAVRKHYDLILIDTGVNFDDTTLYILDNANKIVFLSTMDIVALKNTRLGLNVMESLGYDEEKVKLVINRFNTSYGISKKDVEGAFDNSIFAIIPDDEKTVSLSVNRGQPFVEGGRLTRTKMEKAIEALCNSLIE